MSLKGSPQVNLKPDTDVKTPSIFPKQNSGKRVADGSRTKCAGTSRFRLPKRPDLLPMRYLQHIGRKVSSVMRFISIRRRGSAKEGVSSSGRAKPFVTPIDSHRAAAIDDCIEFINSSSSLRKSNSVSG